MPKKRKTIPADLNVIVALVQDHVKLSPRKQMSIFLCEQLYELLNVILLKITRVQVSLIMPELRFWLCLYIHDILEQIEGK